MAVEVKDPAYKARKEGGFAPVMRAGDIRELKASPSLSLSPYLLGVVVFLISLCVIGTHGLLSGTATMDFGGKKGAATAVAMIDGFVYLGTALQSFALGKITSHDWAYWPWFLAPFALIGFLLSLRIWNARPSGASAHLHPAPEGPRRGESAGPQRGSGVAEDEPRQADLRAPRRRAGVAEGVAEGSGCA